MLHPEVVSILGKTRSGAMCLAVSLVFEINLWSERQDQAREETRRRKLLLVCFPRLFPPSVFSKPQTNLALNARQVFSSVSTTVFSTFSCDYVEDLDVSLLRADYSTSCDHPDHRFYKVRVAERTPKKCTQVYDASLAKHMVVQSRTAWLSFSGAETCVLISFFCSSSSFPPAPLTLALYSKASMGACGHETGRARRRRTNTKYKVHDTCVDGCLGILTHGRNFRPPLRRGFP